MVTEAWRRGCRSRAAGEDTWRSRHLDVPVAPCRVTWRGCENRAEDTTSDLAEPSNSLRGHLAGLRFLRLGSRATGEDHNTVAWQPRSGQPESLSLSGRHGGHVTSQSRSVVQDSEPPSRLGGSGSLRLAGGLRVTIQCHVPSRRFMPGHLAQAGLSKSRRAEPLRSDGSTARCQ
jgi:hypothetical protein